MTMNDKATSSIFSVIAPVLAGLVAGVVASLIVSARTRPERTRVTDTFETPTVDIESGTSTRESPRAAPYQEREERDERSPTPSLNQEAPPLPSFEERRRHNEEAHQAAIERHRSESPDPSWAPRGIATVSKALTAMAPTAAFSFRKVDCRTTSCSAEIEWPTFGDARTHYTELLVGDYEDVNCARQIVVPDRVDPSLPTTATLVLDHCVGR